MIDYSGTLNGYKERMERITLFDILYKLQNKKMKDQGDQDMDYFGLGLLTLLFFFENMLARNKKTGVRELATFLAQNTRETIRLDAEGYIALARTMIDTMRPSSGKRNRKDFYNYETKKMDYIEYSVLKAEGWDKENNLQYYTLDEAGQELIFATKEYFSEFQISISQLVLRKQLEKGEFVSALRQIDEMQISVTTIQDKIHTIKHEIQRNIISEETFNRYKDLIDDIHRRLEREHTEFEELMLFIRETKNHYDFTVNHGEKDRKAMEMIVKIDRELSNVHFLHAHLLYESLELKTAALDSAGESLYTIGMSAFNFDQEITRKIMSTPLPVESTRILAEPFMSLQKMRTWSLLSVFEPQRVEKVDEEEKNNNFLSFTKSAEDLATIKRRQKAFQQIFKIIRFVMDKKDEITLEEMVKRLKEMNQEVLVHRELYHFWLILHQKSPLSIEEVQANEEHIFFLAFKELGDYKAIGVQELPGSLSIEDKFEVKNMRLRLEGEQHA